jgi:hypothetical protein
MGRSEEAEDISYDFYNCPIASKKAGNWIATIAAGV